jgi:hypothetical protein
MQNLGEFLKYPELAHHSRGGGLVLPTHYSKPQPGFGGPPNSGKADAWKTRLSQREIELFEATAGGLLEILGYPRQFPTPRGATRIERLMMGMREQWRWEIKRLKFRRRWKRSLSESAAARKNATSNEVHDSSSDDTTRFRAN